MDLFAQVVDHRCLGCGKVHPGATEVVLVDGTRVSSYSEAWRHECEARAILLIPGLHRRQLHLSSVEKKRGPKVAEALRITMTQLWQAAQAAKKNDVA